MQGIFIWFAFTT